MCSLAFSCSVHLFTLCPKMLLPPSLSCSLFLPGPLACASHIYSNFTLSAEPFHLHCVIPLLPSDPVTTYFAPAALFPLDSLMWLPHKVKSCSCMHDGPSLSSKRPWSRLVHYGCYTFKFSYKCNISFFKVLPFLVVFETIVWNVYPLELSNDMNFFIQISINIVVVTHDYWKSHLLILWNYSHI